MKKQVNVEQNELIKARHVDTQKAFSNLLEVLQDVAEQDWHEQAACRNSNSEQFFPGQGSTKVLKMAQTICSECVVTEECADYAINRPEIQLGVWGGTVDRERRAIRKQKRDEKRAS